jgi:hypothetical protein
LADGPGVGAASWATASAPADIALHIRIAAIIFFPGRM